MIKIRLTGLPSEIRAIRDKMCAGTITISGSKQDADYQIGNCSDVIHNRGSKYVRMHADAKSNSNQS